MPWEELQDYDEWVLGSEDFVEGVRGKKNWRIIYRGDIPGSANEAGGGGDN